MDTAALLWETVRERKLCPRMRSLDEWLNVRWGRMRIARWQVPVLPLGPKLRSYLIVHDVQHLLTGFDTSYRGEAQLALWELASGGCRRSLFFWLDRITFVAIGLALCPAALPAAWRRGRRARNLYGASVAQLLATPFEQLQARVRRER